MYIIHVKCTLYNVDALLLYVILVREFYEIFRKSANNFFLYCYQTISSPICL